MLITNEISLLQTDSNVRSIVLSLFHAFFPLRFFFLSLQPFLIRSTFEIIFFPFKKISNLREIKFQKVVSLLAYQENLMTFRIIYLFPSISFNFLPRTFFFIPPGAQGDKLSLLTFLRLPGPRVLKCKDLKGRKRISFF